MSQERGPHYYAYVGLLRRLHQLIAEGRGEGDEAEALRDAMDPHWDKMRPEEVEAANALSARLYRERLGGAVRIILSATRERVRQRYTVPRDGKDAA